MNQCAFLEQRLDAIADALTCLLVILLMWGLFTLASWTNQITMNGDNDR